MANETAAGEPRPFDVKTVAFLIELMAKHDLAEIALQEGEQKIRLRRSLPQHHLPPSLSGMTASPPVPAAIPVSPAATPPATPATPAPTTPLKEIKSEMVGTFYSRPKPDKPDFVQVGTAVKPDTTLCLIEAMKIFNEIKAECSGIIREICVKNGEPVDFGTVLFRIEPQV